MWLNLILNLNLDMNEKINSKYGLGYDGSLHNTSIGDKSDRAFCSY